MKLVLVLFFHGVPWSIFHEIPWKASFMEIHVLILHGIPWKIFHQIPWNSMEVFYTGNSLRSAEKGFH